ncbi:MAG: hypothetical protein LIQ31_00265, partial [Planctomycetes bacterium]|nr:hypothetical protein [Planctomycetota bacterium]
MNKTDVPAFIAMALYCCGFLASYGLMQSRPEPFTGITAAGLAHLVSVIVVSLMLPVFPAGGKKGRIFLALCLILGVAVRVPGVEGWVNEWLVRATVLVG